MIAFKPPLIVQRAEDDKTQSSAEFLAHCCPLATKATDHAQAGHTQSSVEFLAHCCPLAKRATDKAGHAQVGHTKPWRAKSGVPMIVFKPPLIVQQADDNKTQSSAEYLACFPVEAQEGHAQADQTLPSFSWSIYIISRLILHLTATYNYSKMYLIL